MADADELLGGTVIPLPRNPHLHHHWHFGSNVMGGPILEHEVLCTRTLFQALVWMQDKLREVMQRNNTFLEVTWDINLDLDLAMRNQERVRLRKGFSYYYEGKIYWVVWMQTGMANCTTQEGERSPEAELRQKFNEVNNR